MTNLGYFQSKARGRSRQDRIEFLKMRGPIDKGVAELAMTKVKGCVESPSSEPGFSMENNGWEELEVINLSVAPLPRNASLPI